MTHSINLPPSAVCGLLSLIREMLMTCILKSSSVQRRWASP